MTPYIVNILGPWLFRIFFCQAVPRQSHRRTPEKNNECIPKNDWYQHPPSSQHGLSRARARGTLMSCHGKDDFYFFLFLNPLVVPRQGCSQESCILSLCTVNILGHWLSRICVHISEWIATVKYTRAWLSEFVTRWSHRTDVHCLWLSSQNVFSH